MNIATVGGQECFDTERERLEVRRFLESKGYQVMPVDIERADKPYVIKWRPVREQGTKWPKTIH